MAQIDPKVQQIIDSLNMNKPSGYQTQTQTYQTTNAREQLPVSYNQEYRSSINNQEFISHPNTRVSYSETVKRSGAPARVIESNVTTGGAISMEEWRMRHPESNDRPMASISHEEWMARQGNRTGQIESITHEEWQNRQARGPIESITHEEWLNRQSRGPVESITQEEWLARQNRPVETITEEEWKIRQSRGPIQTITQEEWLARQNAGGNVRTSYVSSSPLREEVVKKSGYGGNSYYTSSVAPYDYRDFRPKDFNYEYREYKPIQYETYTAPPQQVVYETRPQVVQVEERREETTKQGGKKHHVVMEGNEKKSSNWCC